MMRKKTHKQKTSKRRCKDKIAHETRDFAIIALKKSQKNSNYKLFRNAHVYKCNICNKWHIGGSNTIEKINNIIDSINSKYKDYSKQ